MNARTQTIAARKDILAKLAEKTVTPEGTYRWVWNASATGLVRIFTPSGDL